MTPHELARHIVDSRQKRPGRPTQIMPSLCLGLTRRAASAFDINRRLRLRGVATPTDGEMRVLLNELVRLQALKKSPLGWVIADWPQLEAIAKEGENDEVPNQ